MLITANPLASNINGSRLRLKPSQCTVGDLRYIYPPGSSPCYLSSLWKQTVNIVSGPTTPKSHKAFGLIGGGSWNTLAVHELHLRFAISHVMNTTMRRASSVSWKLLYQAQAPYFFSDSPLPPQPSSIPEPVIHPGLTTRHHDFHHLLWTREGS